MGAAVAGAMCAMLMQQAMKEEDPQMKQMLMMMAMQECAQAAQSAQSADKNNNSKNKLSQADTPKMPPSPAFKAPSTPQESPMANSIAKDDGPAFDPGPGLSMEGPSASAAKGGSSGEDEKQSGYYIESLSQLKPIENPNLTYQENSKGGGTTPSGNGPVLMSSASARGLSTDEIKALIEEKMNGATREKGRINVANAEAGEASVAGTSTSGSGGSDSKDFDSMLASLMGAQGGEGLMGGAINDVLAFGPAQSATKVNIFKYASYRYHRASSEESRIQASRPRTIASQVAQ